MADVTYVWDDDPIGRIMRRALPPEVKRDFTIDIGSPPGKLVNLPPISVDVQKDIDSNSFCTITYVFRTCSMTGDYAQGHYTSVDSSCTASDSNPCKCIEATRGKQP